MEKLTKNFWSVIVVIVIFFVFLFVYVQQNVPIINETDGIDQIEPVGLGDDNLEPIPSAPTDQEPSTEPPVSEPADSIPPPTDVVIRRQARVNKVEILILESFPVQVQVVATGGLPDGCTELDEINTVRDGNQFNISITTARPAEVMCILVAPTFEEKISLDVQGLPKGEYTVNVNGVEESFELQVDNKIQ
jgi:hypothetical protein